MNARLNTVPRLVSAHDGTLTKGSAREVRAFLRANGYADRAAQVTGATKAETVAWFLASRGAEVTVVPFADLTPAQRGQVTRKRNTRTARKAANAGRPSTGFMRAYLAARKTNPSLTTAAFALTFTPAS